MNEPPPAVLHLAPHPDDELIGAPAALMALRDAGWRVVNLTCSLGAPGDRRRRLAEVAEACRRAGFVSEVLGDPLGDPLGEPLDDPLDPTAPGVLGATTARLQEAFGAALERHRPRVVVSPSPHDRHPVHEVVGRAALAACAQAADAGTSPERLRLWLWGLWADLPFATLAVAFDEARLEEILGALEAHRGELDRNDYRRLVRGRAEATSVLGPERVFGFGAPGTERPYAEVLCELARERGRWLLGAPRWLEGAEPLGRLTGTVLDGWLGEASLTDRFGPPAG